MKIFLRFPLIRRLSKLLNSLKYSLQSKKEILLHLRLLKLLFLGCLSFSTAEERYVTFEVDDMAELQYKPDYTDKAFGETKIDSKEVGTRWPFEALSIGHSIASFQSYRWNQAYFHHGIDMW